MTSRRTALAATATVLALGGALALPAQADAATTSPAPSAAAQACDRTPWEAKVEGAPQGFGSGSPSGDYLWHDRTGFHLRVTHVRNDQKVYSGVIHRVGADADGAGQAGEG